MNKKALRLFGEVFLKTIIVILGMAIVAFVIFFMMQKFGSGKKTNTSEEPTGIVTEELPTDASTEENTTTEPVTEEPTTEEPISSVGHSIEILNSTDVAGVAAGWQERLNNAGFTVSQIGNYEVETLTTSKIIVTQDGMGMDLLEYFPGASVEVGTIDSGVEIQIIVGTNDVQ
ncbi:MAG: LytR C-terminal domain-containing protein [Lachnospiraceae bacterium]|nr:LytR C-terminal domain-containing protein [Lachnospiraceae bacterium]